MAVGAAAGCFAAQENPAGDPSNPFVDLLRSNLPTRVRGRCMAKVKHVERTYVKSEFRPLSKVNGVDRAAFPATWRYDATTGWKAMMRRPSGESRRGTSGASATPRAAADSMAGAYLKHGRR